MAAVTRRPGLLATPEDSVHAQPGSIPHMADIEIFGELTGAFKREDHSFVHEGRVVEIRSRSPGDATAGEDVWEVAVRWPSASGEDREDELALQAWFDAYLLASSVAVGSAAWVRWNGIYKYNPDGTRRLGKSLTTSWAYRRREPERFDAGNSLADGVRCIPEARDAAEDLRHAMTLLSGAFPAAGAAAYIAVERLVVAQALTDWREFGERLEHAGSTKTADDLLQLWASFQFFRHDPAKTKKAKKRLTVIGRDALDYGRCCWLAAEVFEDYVDAKARGAI